MKNLKIGAKILLGFGVVIALMVVIAIVVLVTNLSSIDNVNVVSYDSDLQTMGNEVRKNFLNAQVSATLMTTATDDSNYQTFKGYEAQIEKYYQDMFTQINKYPVLQEYKAAVDTSYSYFKEYTAVVHELGALNVSLIEDNASLLASGKILAESTNLIIDDQLTSLKSDISSGADSAELVRRTDRVSSGSDIADEIYSFRMLAKEISLTFNSSLTTSILEQVDKALADITVYRDESTRQSQIDNANTVINAITEYRASMVVWGEKCLQNDKIITNLNNTQAQLLEAISGAMNDLDVGMTNQINATISSSTMALIIVIVISAVSIFAAVILAFAIMGSITKPVAKMQNMMQIVGNTGRMRFTDDEIAEIKSAISKDEIGQSVATFSNMMDRLVYVAGELELVSQGDLTVSIKAIGEDDTISNAVIEMVDKLNNMFSEINQATLQVSSGSHQIAEGAQALASGSTEQAASIEELSSSISEVADKTNENATMAGKAAGLSISIKENAQKGTAQMDNMMKAVNEINEASQNIGKVIKVIDDIAFQTNILALNAAVEAARAGEAGKGFAVVADEVRNLAAKSAEAAKDTSGLIANSIEKAELGARIASETSASLSEIVSGINESAEIITNISETSNEQAVSVQQINTGIDQVAQVVQQNSATAEESAAASEELNSQSTLLSELVSQFKLKQQY